MADSMRPSRSLPAAGRSKTGACIRSEAYLCELDLLCERKAPMRRWPSFATPQ